MDFADLSEFAAAYAKAWCSQNPESVAAFFAEHGSMSVNNGPPAVGRAAIAREAQAFMTTFPGHGRDVRQTRAARRSNGVSLDINWNEHRTGRHGKTCSHQRLRTLEDRQRRIDRANQKAISMARSTNASSRMELIGRAIDLNRLRGCN